MYIWNDGASLYHYGIIGQKHGERRYQNPDGTYTEEGLRRKRLTYSTTSPNPTNRARNTSWGVDQSMKNSIKNRQILNASSQIADRTRNILNTSTRKRKVPKSIHEMSDQELRQEVNRMQLENQYMNLKSERTITGKDYLNATLELAGNVLAIGASAATIAMAISQAKKQ